MGAAIRSITVAYHCDAWCMAVPVEVTASNLKEARIEVMKQGWRVGRAHGYERVTCPACSKRDAKLVADGIVDKKGIIIDMARYEAFCEGSKR